MPRGHGTTMSKGGVTSPLSSNSRTARCRSISRTRPHTTRISSFRAELGKFGVGDSHSGLAGESIGYEHFGRLLPCATVVGAETKITVGVAGIDKHIAAIVQLVDTGVCAGANFLWVILPVYHDVAFAWRHGRDIRLSRVSVIG